LRQNIMALGLLFTRQPVSAQETLARKSAPCPLPLCRPMR
jgi:hypothetical protein